MLAHLRYLEVLVVRKRELEFESAERVTKKQKLINDNIEFYRTQRDLHLERTRADTDEAPFISTIGTRASFLDSGWHMGFAVLG